MHTGKMLSSKKGVREGSMQQNSIDTEPFTTTKALQVLDDISRQIKTFERKLHQQRVNCAIVTVELSTLHDPLLRESLALCFQNQECVQQKLAQSNEIQAQSAKILYSSMPHETGEHPPQETMEVVNDEPQQLLPSYLVNEESNLPQSHDSISVVMEN
ncbi:uncharacterized protein [Procambarus clarkii]|uniref:uncharacterized protein isoform X2 n=1 Tax=Procambarus clarkii TaxID=6728 RepID=UPI003744377E